jgi:hypothetical protein
VTRSYKPLAEKRLFPKLLPSGNDIIVLGGQVKTAEMISSTVQAAFDAELLNGRIHSHCNWDNFIKEFSLI